MADHGGVVPHEDAALRALPGVGPYTARAVRTFAFGDDVAAVDTNAVRVLARGVTGAPLTLRRAMALGDQLVPAGDSWEFNQAMFDLGATVCTAARPDCARCPLRRQCAWRRDGAGAADPWRLGPTARPQSTFAGSDRQGRGRLLDALRRGGVRRGDLAARLRLARGPGAGPAGGRGDGGRGVRTVVRRAGPRPPAVLKAGRRGGHPHAGRAQEAVRKPRMRPLTTSGRSTWRKWPARSTISTAEPSAMKSSGDPMEESSMQLSSRPWR